MLEKRKKSILDTLQNVVNYELWVASGVGCSICNPYYHGKFDSMGMEGLFFDDLAYCSNFFRNSNNYLNTFRNMRFIQHNINVILNFLKTKGIPVFGNTMDRDNFFHWAKLNQMYINPNLNPQNLWRYGLKFGIEYSSDKLLSQRAKVNNCIEDIKSQNYSAECQEICLNTNPTNEVTINNRKFVISLLMAEYVIDQFWEKTNPGHYTDTIMKQFPLNNTDVSENLSKEIDPKTKILSANKKRAKFMKKGAIVLPNSIDIDKPNDKFKTINDFNMVKYYYEQMLSLSFKSVFAPRSNLGEAKNSKNYIDFEKLDSTVVSFKASWVPFINSMKYENVRVTYDDHKDIYFVSLISFISTLFLFNVFN